MNKEKKGWFSKITSGLKKTSSKLTEGISAIFTKKKLDALLLEELEDLLIQADLGLPLTQRIIKELSNTRYDQEITQVEIRFLIAKEIQKTLAPFCDPFKFDTAIKPFVILMVGINGSGKTTTTGKLAKLFKEQGKKVRIAACDTFRAAAIEQLETWAERIDVPLTKGTYLKDPAALAYQAFEETLKQKEDVLLIDTAGRLHNKSDLMAELSKIERVLKKLDPTAPHGCFLVLDATGGQNAHQQVKLFREFVGVTGLIITKLDGTSKGGVVVSVCEQFKLPVFYIGVGEKEFDLLPFNPENFSHSIVDLEGKD